MLRVCTCVRVLWRQERFLSFYTDSGGTAANNRALAVVLQAWPLPPNASLVVDDDPPPALARARRHAQEEVTGNMHNASPELLLVDDTLTPLPPPTLSRVPVIVKRVRETHDDTCRRYFEQVLMWA